MQELRRRERHVRWVKHWGARLRWRWPAEVPDVPAVRHASVRRVHRRRRQATGRTAVVQRPRVWRGHVVERVLVGLVVLVGLLD